MAIYTSENAFEEAQEKEFRRKVKELNSYKNGIRYTDDGGWTEEDLFDDLEGELIGILNAWKEKNKYRALVDSSLVYPQKLLEVALEQLDESLIDIYNRTGSIYSFEMTVLNKVHSILDNNLVTK